MTIRKGADYIEGLRKAPREVWMNGERVADVTEHPAFRRIIDVVASIYDAQSGEHQDILTHQLPDGQRVPTAFLIARSKEDLRKRRAAFQLVAESSFGMVGRSPDYMNTMLAALYDGRSYLASHGEQYVENLRAYFEYVRDSDLFLTHSLVTPQNDRSKASHEQADPFLHLGVVRETEDGLIVRGARMLATMGPIADEVLIYSLPGLKPGDEKHAVAFAMPLSTPGIRQIARPAFETGASSDYFDRPLASRFEEPDSLLIFDDVLVPWSRVFINQSVEHSNGLYGATAVREFAAQQSSVRGFVKLRLITGVMLAVAEAVKADIHLHVQTMLGECLDALEIVESCLLRAEEEGTVRANGTMMPNMRPYHATRTFLPTLYPRAVEYLQKIGAGGLLMIPDGADFVSAIGQDVAKYYQGANISSLDRTRLFKLAWDLCGDAFGGRQLQYERYYVGDPVRLLAASFLTGNRAPCNALVERALALAGNPQPAFEEPAKIAAAE